MADEYVQVDFGYFGPPEEHYKWTKEKREGVYVTPEEPSSEIGGEMAAALGAAAVAFHETDPAYAQRLVEGAQTVSHPMRFLPHLLPSDSLCLRPFKTIYQGQALKSLCMAFLTEQSSIMLSHLKVLHKKFQRC